MVCGLGPKLAQKGPKRPLFGQKRGLGLGSLVSRRLASVFLAKMLNFAPTSKNRGRNQNKIWPKTPELPVNSRPRNPGVFGKRFPKNLKRPERPGFWPKTQPGVFGQKPQNLKIRVFGQKSGVFGQKLTKNPVGVFGQKASPVGVFGQKGAKNGLPRRGRIYTLWPKSVHRRSLWGLGPIFQGENTPLNFNESLNLCSPEQVFRGK